MAKISASRLPASFKTILWSYDFATLDPEVDKKTIIVQSINYGDLTHWRWLITHYGKETVHDIIETIPATEFRPRALRLATFLFAVRHLNHVPRGAH